MASTQDKENFEIFRDCVSEVIARALADTETHRVSRGQGTHAGGKAARKRRASKKAASEADLSHEKNGNDGESEGENRDIEELSEFIEYLAQEIFTCLPTDLRELSYSSVRNYSSLAEKYSLPLTMGFVDELVAKHIMPSVTDSLATYGILSPPEREASNVLQPILTSYITIVSTPAPALVPLGPRPSACEICCRDWVPLTYHHLIPKSTHARVLKRGWHEEWRLNSVAWLCRACHSAVHGIAGNEELARHWFTVDLLLGREDIQKWAAWIGRVRWKSK